MFAHGDGVLTVSGARAIGGDNRPSVGLARRRRHTRRREPSVREPARLRAGVRGRVHVGRGSRHQVPRALPGQCRAHKNRGGCRNPPWLQPVRSRRRYRQDGRLAPSPRCPPPELRSAVSIKRIVNGSPAPTAIENAASPCQPLTIAPQSIDNRSPSCKTRSPGMPWITSSFTDAHKTPGNPWYPRKFERAPRRSNTSADNLVEVWQSSPLGERRA